MSQARLPGTVPPPEEVRATFRRVRAELEKAARDFAMAEGDVTEHRKALKEALAAEAEKAKAFADSEEPDVEREYWEAVELSRSVATMLKASRRTRSECRRIHERRRAEYEAAREELDAIRRGRK